jgi:hypothetical protein
MSDIPRNASRTVRTVRIDVMFAAGFPLAGMLPNQRCGHCGDRMGSHDLVVDGTQSDAELISAMMQNRVAGTIESTRRTDSACATFGVRPRLVP